jgi:hypothetical protein
MSAPHCRTCRCGGHGHEDLNGGRRELRLSFRRALYPRAERAAAAAGLPVDTYLAELLEVALVELGPATRARERDDSR